MSDEATNVVAFTPRPPEAPAPLRLELRLHAEDCSVEFFLIDDQDNVRAVIPYRPDSSITEAEREMLRSQWPRWREQSAVAS